MPKTGDWGFGLYARRTLPKSSVFKFPPVIPPPDPPAFTPSFQFNDARNSQYLVFLAEDF